MSVLFKDKVFEELNSSDDGWLTLATSSMINEFEAIVAENDVDEINDELKQFARHAIQSHGYASLHLSNFIKGKSTYKLKALCETTFRAMLEQFYAINVLDNNAEDANFAEVYIKAHSIEESELLELLRRKVGVSFNVRMANARLNRMVVALFDNHENIRRYNKYDKSYKIQQKIAEVLFDNVWNIKSFELLLKLKNYIMDLSYINDSIRENAVNKVMLMRLRASSGDPVYSLEGF